MNAKNIVWWIIAILIVFALAKYLGWFEVRDA